MRLLHLQQKRQTEKFDCVVWARSEAKSTNPLQEAGKKVGKKKAMRSEKLEGDVKSWPDHRQGALREEG